MRLLRRGGMAAAPERMVLALSEELSAALARQARQLGVTLNSLLLACWAILLGRLSGRADVVFGVTVAGRPPEIAGIERMVGLFINTLPLRVRLAPGQPVLELIAQVQESQSRLLAQQHVGLAEIQQLAGIGELFDTLMVFENYPVARDALARPAGGVRLCDMAGEDRAHYPLNLAVVPGARLTLRLDYRCRPVRSRRHGGACGPAGAAVGSGASGAGSADRAARHSVGGGAAHAADGMERDCAGAALLPPCRSCLRRRRQRTPAAAAVVCDAGTLSYGELELRANQLAHHLRALGVGPEVVVGLCVERSPAMIVALIAILKAGGAYLPLDPDYPRERLAFMLADAGAPVLVTQSTLLDRLPAHAARLVQLDADAALIAQQPDTAPAVALDPQHAAYVIYTSGSTGTPEGRRGAHHGIPNVAAARSRTRTRYRADATTMSFCTWRRSVVRCLDLRNLGGICSAGPAWSSIRQRTSSCEPASGDAQHGVTHAVADGGAVASVVDEHLRPLPRVRRCWSAAMCCLAAACAAALAAQGRRRLDQWLWPDRGDDVQRLPSR